jgi:aryl-alcohol dehydrogenase-like predicted oxidoreductase
MEYRNLGNTGVQVSPLCLGTMMFGGLTSEADSRAIIDRALDCGINFMDSADMYNGGESESVLGRALKGRREQVVVATKGRQAMGDTPNEKGASRLHLMQALDNSLRRLDMDHVDVYYTHAPDYSVPIAETLRAMDDMVRSGKVRYIACSNFRAWRLCEALWTSDKLGLDRFACVQPLYNIVNRDVEVELFPLCREHSVGVVNYSPLARGILTGKYKVGEEYPEGSRASRGDRRMQQAELRDPSIQVAAQLLEYCQSRGLAASQFALAWCLANPQLTSSIIGPRTMDHFDDNIGCLEIEITEADEEFVDSLVPPGEHSGFGFQDELYPISGRSRCELG